MPTSASIVIPAHNEEHRIRGLLETLADPSIAGLYDVYVLCNGCIDKTRQVAEEYAGVTVVEIADAGKHFALNQGDRLAADVFPRLYCDADIQISADSIAALVASLSTDEVRAAGPAIRYGVEKSTWAVKLYCQALETQIMTSWQREHLTGRGLYGVSRAGRERFTTFPPLLADDLFFDSQFTSEEKVVVDDSVVTIWVPLSIGKLIRAEIRVTGGNKEYRVAGSENGTPDDQTSARSGRFQLRLGDRVKAVKSWRQNLQRGDVVPIAFYLVVLYSAKLLMRARTLRGLQIRWR